MGVNGMRHAAVAPNISRRGIGAELVIVDASWTTNFQANSVLGAHHVQM